MTAVMVKADFVSCCRCEGRLFVSYDSSDAAGDGLLDVLLCVCRRCWSRRNTAVVVPLRLPPSLKSCSFYNLIDVSLGRFLHPRSINLGWSLGLGIGLAPGTF